MSTGASLSADVLERVARGERVVVRKGRKVVAAIVTPADLKALAVRTVRPTKAETEAIRKARAEGGAPVPWETVRRRAGL